jgi:alanine racemase
MAGSPERALARVSTGAISRNSARLKRELSGAARLCAVVKANGYGHGALESARAALEGGAGWLAVATAEEALALRGAGIDGPLLVMGALSAEEAAALTRAGVDVVAWTLEFVRGLPAGARVHVKLDSGMGRLGTADPEQARAVAAEAAGGDRELVGLMTHFATADELGDEHFPVQLARFTEFADEMRAEHGELLCHAANSAATLREPAAHFDMVRCGIAVYGLDPYGEDPAAQGLEPALELSSWVAAVKPFRAGDSAGYGRSWRAPLDTWVGTLPIGYGDGWRRALSNDCDVLIRGRRYPVVGTISMDNLTVDLGPQTDVEVGASGVLIGSQGDERILCEEVAKRLDTINYEVVTGLLPRVRRLHER